MIGLSAEAQRVMVEAVPMLRATAMGSRKPQPDEAEQVFDPRSKL
jgi:hypothetical protein